MKSADYVIVGAGMAGLACAKGLKAAGASVAVLDKGRGPGGRMSTRRSDVGAFDHGAQYFTARAAGFQAAVEDWISAGCAARWEGRFVRFEGGVFATDKDEARYVGAPKMNAILAHEAEALGVHFGMEVKNLQAKDGLWTALDEAGAVLAAAPRLVLAVPAEQVAMLAAAEPPAASEASAARSAPCWAVMAAFETALPLPYDGVRIKDGPLGWAARDAAKPGRGAGERWVLHASADWSRQFLEDDRDAVAARLLEAFFETFDIAPETPTHLAAHRWRYALVEEAAATPFYWNKDTGFAMAGDWRTGARVEGAWTSGDSLGRALLAP